MTREQAKECVREARFYSATVVWYTDGNKPVEIEPYDTAKTVLAKVRKAWQGITPYEGGHCK